MLQSSDPFLNQTIEASHLANAKTKLSFLQNQQQRLSWTFEDLEQNNSLLRKINKALLKENGFTQDSIVFNLTKQNQLLEKNYLRILKQNQKLTSELLLNQQILDQTEVQNRVIIDSYQSKIVELRRAVQIKECLIQDLQMKIDPERKIIYPPTSVTALFFNEVDQLKRVIDRLTVSNKKYEAENEKIKKRNEFLEKRLNLLQVLTLKSKLTFEQFKQYYSEKKPRNRTLPRKDTELPIQFQQLTLKKVKSIPSLSRTKSSSSIKLSSSPSEQIKMLLYKECLKFDHTKNICIQFKEKFEGEQYLRNKINESYIKGNKKIMEITKEMNHYKNLVADMMRMLSCRADQRSKSQDKTVMDQRLNAVQDASLKIKKINEKISQRKNYWLELRQKLSFQKPKILQIKRKYKNIKRSISCCKDYYTQEKQYETDNPEKIIKSYSKEPKNLKKVKIVEQEPNQEFSLMLDGSLEGQISIISPSANLIKSHKTIQERFLREDDNENIDTMLDDSIL